MNLFELSSVHQTDDHSHCTGLFRTAEALKAYVTERVGRALTWQRGDAPGGRAYWFAYDEGRGFTYFMYPEDLGEAGEDAAELYDLNHTQGGGLVKRFGSQQAARGFAEKLALDNHGYQEDDLPEWEARPEGAAGQTLTLEEVNVQYLVTPLTILG